MIDAGLDPDALSTGSDKSSSSVEQLQAPDLSWGDDGIER